VTIAHIVVVLTRPNLCLALHRRPLLVVHSRSAAQTTITNNSNKEELVYLAIQQTNRLQQASSVLQQPPHSLSSNNKPGHRYLEIPQITQIPRISRQVVESSVLAQHNNHSLSKQLHYSELSRQQQVTQPVAVYLETPRTRILHKTSPRYHFCKIVHPIPCAQANCYPAVAAQPNPNKPNNNPPPSSAPPQPPAPAVSPSANRPRPHRPKPSPG